MSLKTKIVSRGPIEAGGDELHTAGGLALSQLVSEVLGTHGPLIASGDELGSELELSSARWQVMGALRDGGKPVALIARERGLTRQSVQRVVNALAREKFVRLKDNPRHRRAKLVELTPKGINALVKLTIRKAKWVNRLAGSFTMQELAVARAVVSRLRGCIE